MAQRGGFRAGNERGGSPVAPWRSSIYSSCLPPGAQKPWRTRGRRVSGRWPRPAARQFPLSTTSLGVGARPGIWFASRRSPRASGPHRKYRGQPETVSNNVVIQRRGDLWFGNEKRRPLAAPTKNGRPRAGPAVRHLKCRESWWPNPGGQCLPTGTASRRQTRRLASEDRRRSQSYVEVRAMPATPYAGGWRSRQSGASACPAPPPVAPPPGPGSGPGPGRAPSRAAPARSAGFGPPPPPPA